jgi:hypothetical protein
VGWTMAGSRKPATLALPVYAIRTGVWQFANGKRQVLDHGPTAGVRGHLDPD